MTSTTFLELLLLLLLLLLHQVCSEEAEPVFREEGNVIEMGYCFGVDYIVVYRSAPEGDQLLGNSSADSAPITPPADLKRRIHTSSHQQLLGLQISHLTHTDSGIYRRECWQNQTLASQYTQKLSVCDEEVEPEEITVREEDGGAELLCNSTSIGLEGTSVRWYSETYPSYKITLFLDSSVSLDPLVEEMQGVLEVRDGGALLLLKNSLLKNNPQFYCLVIKGKNCLSFQNIYLPDRSENRVYFASLGDRVVLHCSSDGNDQQWETPLGGINNGSVKNNQTYISFGEKSEDFSLVISAVSNHHSGAYSCISSSLEVQYLLVLCPKKESREIFVVEGGNVMLDCDVDKDDAQRVQWHRQEPSGGAELIHDSDDDTVPVPQDLRGRLTLSNNGSSLAISHLEVKDPGVYWCVVLGPGVSEEGDDYIDEYNEEDAGEDEDSYDNHWLDTHRCIFKQDKILSLIKSTGRMNLEPVTRNFGSSPTADANVAAYAVGAGLVALLLVVGVIAVIAIKRRAKASPKQSKAASCAGRNTAKNIKMNVHSGCTERLTHNDEYGA